MIDNRLMAKHQKSSSKLPNLIIIGAMKCGTSSLHQYLNLHPQVQMTQIKELDFFIQEKNWSKGLDWYRSNFQQSAQIIGESSPNYAKRHIFPDVPARMHSLIPNAKLIYIVRDPIKRVISHYNHQYIDRCEHSTIEKILSDINNNYIKTSLYYWQLEYFLEYYSKDKVFVISLEDLSRSPFKVLKQIFNFLEVDISFKHNTFKRAFHQSQQKRRLTFLGEKIVSLPMGYRLVNNVPSIFSTKVKKPSISKYTIDILENILLPDITKLRAFTGNDFAYWSI